MSKFATLPRTTIFSKIIEHTFQLATISNMAEASQILCDFDDLMAQWVQMVSLNSTLKSEKKHLMKECDKLRAECERLTAQWTEKVEEQSAALQLDVTRTRASTEVISKLGVESKMKSENESLRYHLSVLTSTNSQLERQLQLHKAENINLQNKIRSMNAKTF